MSTSNGSTPTVPGSVPDRGPLRLRLNDHHGRDTLDGGWWPRSGDLAVELAELADHFPADLGSITRALVSPPDWDHVMPGVPSTRGRVEVGSLPRDAPHLAHLTTSLRTRLRLLVIPPDFSDDQGEEALLAAATPGNAHAAIDLLDTVTENPDVDPRDLWPADG